MNWSIINALIDQENDCANNWKHLIKGELKSIKSKIKIEPFHLHLKPYSLIAC